MWWCKHSACSYLFVRKEIGFIRTLCVYVFISGMKYDAVERSLLLLNKNCLTEKKKTSFGTHFEVWRVLVQQYVKTRCMWLWWWTRAAVQRSTSGGRVPMTSFFCSSSVNNFNQYFTLSTIMYICNGGEASIPCLPVDNCWTLITHSLFSSPLSLPEYYMFYHLTCVLLAAFKHWKLFFKYISYYIRLVHGAYCDVYFSSSG